MAPLFRLHRPIAFIGASLPLLWLLVSGFGVSGLTLGPNPIREMLHFTGKTAVNLLMIALALGLLSRASRDARWLGSRRIIGLFAFFYAALHLTIYVALELEFDFSDIAREFALRPYIIVGAAALLTLVPLAVTSTDRWMRRLGRRWTRLHALIYPATALALWHYAWQVKLDLLEPGLYAFAFLVLSWLRWRRVTNVN
ncbi:MAG: sulfite oxidase heme-binding subunit YedZ [Steroidobacteraceae bacterium]